MSILILNQIIQSFTAKWHKISEEQDFENEKIKNEVRKELGELQKELKIYTRMLADMAGVKNMINL